MQAASPITAYVQHETVRESSRVAMMERETIKALALATVHAAARYAGIVVGNTMAAAAASISTVWLVLCLPAHACGLASCLVQKCYWTHFTPETPATPEEHEPASTKLVMPVMVHADSKSAKHYHWLVLTLRNVQQECAWWTRLLKCSVKFPVLVMCAVLCWSFCVCCNERRCFAS